jgi:hypothetical protein
MAQWIGIARTNYVKVQDLEGLTQKLKDTEIRLTEGHAEHKGMYALIAGAGDGWPTTVFDAAHEDGEWEFSLQEDVVPFLAPGQVFVAMEVGFEKERYVTGNAVAFNTTTGKLLQVNLNDIYDLAKDMWQMPVPAAEY